MTKRVRVVDGPEFMYECFECGATAKSLVMLAKCPVCEEKQNFYLMS